jgi:hypothetical protein
MGTLLPNLFVRNIVVLVVGLALVVLGCGKKSSKEYFEAQRRYESLLTQEGDGAYLTVEMKTISEALAAVPPRALEYERAQALVAKIASERGRLEQERSALASAATADEPATSPSFQPSLLATDVPGATLEAFDAGSDDFPSGGMLEALFQEKYRGCVTGPELIALDGQGQVPAYKVDETSACQKKLGVTGATRFFFIKGALAGKISSTLTRTVSVVDGGGTTTIPGATQPYLGVPGAPRPGAVAPPQAPGALVPSGTGSGLQPTQAVGELSPRTP